MVKFTTMKWLSEYVYPLFRIFLPKRKIDCDGKLLKINFFNGVCQSDPKILCLVLLIFGKKFLTKLIKSKIFQSLPANYLQTLYSYLQKITAKFILPLRSLILRKFSTSCQISGCRFPWLDLTSSQLIWVPANDSTRHLVVKKLRLVKVKMDSELDNCLQLFSLSTRGSPFHWECFIFFKIKSQTKDLFFAVKPSTTKFRWEDSFAALIWHMRSSRQQWLSLRTWRKSQLRILRRFWSVDLF